MTSLENEDRKGLLANLANGTSFADFPASLSAATARFSALPHCFGIVVFFGLGRTGITDIGTEAAKLMSKPRISRQQPESKSGASSFSMPAVGCDLVRLIGGGELQLRANLQQL
jgi:hypothetical protein